MNWECLTFSQLTTDQLYELLKLRVDIFVVEQNCPYHELDEHDRHPETRHLLGYQGDQLVAYLRILPPGCTYPQVSIGRVAVHQLMRGKGASHALLQQGLDHAESIWPEQSIKLGAQSYLLDFYKKHGFKVVSEEYLEDGIPHIDMTLQAS